MTTKIIDYTKGIHKYDRQYQLIVQFQNGTRYSFTGKTKMEASTKFKKTVGTSSKGIVKKEWYFTD